MCGHVCFSNHTSAFVPAAADCPISDELAESPLSLSHPITAVIDIRPMPHHSDKILIKINNTAAITNLQRSLLGLSGVSGQKLKCLCACGSESDSERESQKEPVSTVGREYRFVCISSITPSRSVKAAVSQHKNTR